MALVFAGLAGCSLRASHVEAIPNDDLEFLGRVVDDNSSDIGSLWKQTLAMPISEERSLRIALLQTVPGHRGYDPAAAQRTLRSLAALDQPKEVAVIARVRLDALTSQEECQARAQDLQRRLSKVVDIERQLDAKAPTAKFGAANK